MLKLAFDNANQTADLARELRITSEIVTVNLLPADARNAENAPTGFTTWSTRGIDPTLSASVAEHWQGTKSLKVDSNGGSAANWQGFSVPISLAGSAGKTYTFSCYLKAAAGVVLALKVIDSANGFNSGWGPEHVMDGTWQRLSMTFTVGALDAVLSLIAVEMRDANVIFYADGLQLEEGPAATEWLDGSHVVEAPTRGNLETDEGLETACLLSIFTDARADGARGWWGDSFAPVDGHVTGSKLWTLARAHGTKEDKATARASIIEALRWLVDDGIASSVDVVILDWRPGVLVFEVKIERGSNSAPRWARTWEVSLGLQ